MAASTAVRRRAIQFLHRVSVATRAGVAVGLLAWFGVAVGSSVANGSAKPVGKPGGQRSATATVHLAKATPGSPFPDDFSGNPLVPGRDQRSVTYLLSHDGYSAPLSVRRSGTLEVIWTAIEATGPITLATGEGTYHEPGAQRFKLRLTRNGRAVLTRQAKLTFRVAGWYGRKVRERSWMCLYEVNETAAHKLVFANACGP
jgi:hypothetical protein